MNPRTAVTKLSLRLHQHIAFTHFPAAGHSLKVCIKILYLKFVKIQDSLYFKDTQRADCILRENKQTTEIRHPPPILKALLPHNITKIISLISIYKILLD